MTITIAHPCPGYYITQPFGVNKAHYSKFGLEGHPGIDYATPAGTPLRSCYGGWIDTMAVSAAGYGLYVIVRHACFYSLYGHLDEFSIPVGQWVARDQVIALSGGSPGTDKAGNSTGPHLHFEIRPFIGGLAAFGGAIDPAPLIESPEHAGRPKALILCTYLNLRKGPTVNSPVVGAVKHGIIVTVLEEDHGWLRIDQPKKGWINKNFTQFIK